MELTAMLVVDGHSVDPARLADVCDHHGITELYVFGSVARGEATASSDIDLLYVLAPGRRLGFSINRLEDELTELFGRPVDLISKRALHPRLSDDVVAQARLLYAA